MTLSGDSEAIKEYYIALKADKVFTRAVNTNSKAYHSYYIKPVSADYKRLVCCTLESNIFINSPLPTNTTIVSTVYNKKLLPEAIDKRY